MTAILTALKNSSVGMGQITLATRPDKLTTVLGSCIGALIYHPRLHIGVLAHVVLPDSAGRDANPGKFADTAIPHMISLLRNEGVSKSGMIAKLAGGSDMFGSSGPMQIGQRNLEAVTEALKKVGIRIAAQHVGGRKGRRATFDSASGELKIEIAGTIAEIL